MPWHLSDSHPDCSGWAVVKDSDGSLAGCHDTKAEAQAHMAALYANVKEASMSDNEHREVRTLEMSGFEIRHSGRPDESFTIRGYPIVYGEWSHDLGGFKERIREGAADEVLRGDPTVHFTWDHDTRYVGASTGSRTLSLRSDTKGVFMDAQVGNYSWSKDLRTALERGDIAQGSFAFTVNDGGDEWSVDEETNEVTRTIKEIGNLYDVTVTAQGAYPQTSLAAVRSLAAIGRQSEAGAIPVAPEEGGSESHEGSEDEDPEWEMLRAQSLVRSAELKSLAERLRRLR